MIIPTETWCEAHFTDGSVLSLPSDLFSHKIHEETVSDMIENCDRIVVREVEL